MVSIFLLDFIWKLPQTIEIFIEGGINLFRLIVHGIIAAHNYNRDTFENTS